MYGHNAMSKKKRKEFITWHDERVRDNYVFDMKKELREYCISDVNLLRKGCMKLREEFLKIADTDPFCCITIVADCISIYRSKYLKPNTIAVVDYNEDIYSVASISWLMSLQFNNETNNYSSTGPSTKPRIDSSTDSSTKPRTDFSTDSIANPCIDIRHAMNGGEVTICGAKVDGSDAITNTVYQYHCWFWHGCLKCFDGRTINSITLTEKRWMICIKKL